MLFSSNFIQPCYRLQYRTCLQSFQNISLINSNLFCSFCKISLNIMCCSASRILFLLSLERDYDLNFASRGHIHLSFFVSSNLQKRKLKKKKKQQPHVRFSNIHFIWTESNLKIKHHHYHIKIFVLKVWCLNENQKTLKILLSVNQNVGLVSLLLLYNIWPGISLLLLFWSYFDLAFLLLLFNSGPRISKEVVN